MEANEGGAYEQSSNDSAVLCGTLMLIIDITISQVLLPLIW